MNNKMVEMKIDIETILQRYNSWWQAAYTATGIAREKYLDVLIKNLENKQIIFLTGLRRVGKTTIMKQFISKIISKNKINPSRVLFLSFDDPVFISLSINEIIEKFRKINSLKFEEKIYLFFDEISYREDFSRELKVIHDNQNVKIFASGSSALDIMDKKAFLTGRVFYIKIYPLNFEEYLIFKNLKLNPSDPHLKEKYFESYLKNGGMPEYVLTEDPEYIKTVIEDVIYKDIARKYHIKNIDKLKEIFLLLCERVGKRISYNKLSNIAGLDKETVETYISYFQQTFLFKIISKYAKTLNERIYSQKKVYISDNGIRSIFVDYKDKGSLFENFVFNELQKKFADIFYYYEDNHEIDFIVRKSPRGELAVEVKMNKDDKNLKFFSESRFKNKFLIENFEDIAKVINKNS